RDDAACAAAGHHVSSSQGVPVGRTVHHLEHSLRWASGQGRSAPPGCFWSLPRERGADQPGRCAEEAGMSTTARTRPRPPETADRAWIRETWPAVVVAFGLVAASAYGL